MRIRHLTAAAFAIACLAIPGAALGDCQPAGPMDEALAQAPLAFVGTVIDVRGGGAQIAMIEVEERWTGAANIANAVEVLGLGNDQGPSEDDRRWELGARYLVVPIVDGDVLRDSICSATTLWQPELEALRPTAGPATGSEAPIPLLPIVVAVVVVAMTAAAFIGYDRLAGSRRGPSEGVAGLVRAFLRRTRSLAVRAPRQ